MRSDIYYHKDSETLFRQIANKCETVLNYKLKNDRYIYNNIANYPLTVIVDNLETCLTFPCDGK